MDRKEFFTKGLRDLYKQASETAFGGAVDKQLQGLSNFLDPRGLESQPRPAQADEDEEVYCRPPGAVSDQEKFSKLCTSCGDCIIACPHGALFSPGKELGPLFAPNYSACRLCDDYPCISACETGALVSLGDELPGFGRAVLREAGCLNYSSPKKTCRVCEQECPVEDTVIFNKHKLPEFADTCTGCGICRAACPGEGDTIRIV